MHILLYTWYYTYRRGGVAVHKFWILRGGQVQYGLHLWTVEKHGTIIYSGEFSNPIITLPRINSFRKFVCLARTAEVEKNFFEASAIQNVEENRGGSDDTYCLHAYEFVASF